MRRATIRALALCCASALLAVPAAWAQDAAEGEESFEIEVDEDEADEEKIRELTTPSSEIEAGLFWSADHSFEFGDYTGLEHSGFSVLGNADLEWRTPWDAETPYHFSLEALNLGLDSRRVTTELERPGRYGVFFRFDEIPKLWSNNVRTIFFKDGDSDFRLPVPWDPGTAPASMDLFGASLHGANSRFLRRTLGGGFSVVLPEDVEFITSFDRQTKKGRYFEGATMGLTGGNPRAVALNERVDYSTDLWETALRWAREELQLQFQYQGSHFNDHEDSVTWENPYVTNAAWSPLAGYPGTGACLGSGIEGCGLGRKAQPPDNWFNQMIGSGGYDLPFWNTRLTANVAVGWMGQDDDYLPYTVNQGLTVSTPLPRDNLNGEINTQVLNFAIDSRPLPKTRLNLHYRFDRRDNDSPRDVYIYVRNDSENQGSISSGQARINRPYSFRHHELDFDASYTIWERTDWTVGYEWDQWHRSFQEAEQVWNNTVFTRLASHPWSWLTTRMEYRHTWQDRSSYSGVRPLLYGESDEALVGFDPATDFENHPLLRKFYMAEGQKDQLTSMITLIPHEDVAIALSNHWVNDEYDDAALGLREMKMMTSGIDVSWYPTERVTASVFYSFERFLAHQNSWSFSNLAQSTDPNRRWRGRDKDLAHTAGLNVHFDVLPERLGIDTQFLFAQSKGLTGIVRGAGLVAPGADPDYPDDRTRAWDVSIRADYRIWKGLGTRVGYLFERLDSRNWALDGVTPGNLTCSANSCVITSGQKSPEATTHLVTWSVYYDFFW
jgi:MtrB/PioB family decaheme-associated outer membrane protein